MRKHRLAERLLADIIGLDWELVHEEACRWEHVMSEQVERRLVAILDHPRESPYGNPIPGLDQLGMSPSEPFMTGVVSILTAVTAADAPVTGTVRRLGEPVQFAPELLANFRRVGVVPGALVVASRAGRDIQIQAVATAASLDVSDESASHIFLAQ